MATKKPRLFTRVTRGVTSFKHTNFDSLPKVYYPYPELLFQLLVTINMFEGTDEKMTHDPVCRLRDALNALVSSIQFRDAYQTQESVEAMDKVFIDAGWDDNGLRWNIDGFGDMHNLHIVEFRNSDHAEWNLL
jgi:hypothetical protein